jgi:hypothetical protein
MSELTDTQPTKTRKTMRKFPFWASALIVVLLLALGAFGGYNSALGSRRGAEATQNAQQVTEQFILGVQALDAGQYQVAKAHLKFVLDHDPNFPGAMEKWTALLLLTNLTPTVPPEPTMTLSPTPDLRGVEELFARAQEFVNARDWDNALQTLDSLRRADATYRVAEVDGMYFVSLYNRGVSKIVLEDGETCSDINLEGGIYDLTLAERFGILDSYASNLRELARLYGIGASYWGIDWAQAQYYFWQLYTAQSYVMDSSCQTATQRFRVATLEYAAELTGKGDYCGAQEQYTLAFTIPGQDDPGIYSTATKVAEQCFGEPKPTRTPASTSTPGGETPTDVPSDTPGS